MSRRRQQSWQVWKHGSQSGSYERIKVREDGGKRRIVASESEVDGCEMILHVRR